MCNPTDPAKKYKELYDLGKQVFYEEITRSTRIDDKASKYLTILTFLLGAFAFFAKEILELILPPANRLEWAFVIVSGSLLFLLVIAWFTIFGVLRIHNFKKIPLDIEFFDNNRLIDVYFALSKGIKENLEFNLRQGNIKSRKLYHGYILIRIIVILLLILSVLFTAHTWMNSTQNKLLERSIKMTEEPKNPPAKVETSKPTEDKPDPNVKPPVFIEVTEGFDPSKIINKEKGAVKEDKKK